MGTGFGPNAAPGADRVADGADYFRVRVATVVPDLPITFDLFVHINGRFVHYLRPGERLSSLKIQNLDRGNVFFVPTGQRALYKGYIFQKMNDPSLEVAKRALILREASLTLAEELFVQQDIQSAIEDSTPVIAQIVEFMAAEPEGMAHMLSLSQHDFYTYNHSLDVSLYSTALGRILGLHEADVVELGRGALFHDIGKRQVDISIITKNGPLDDREWIQMQKHPQYGLHILTDYGCSEAMKACCFEHHENFLGTGYPQKLLGEEIHPMARVIAITDTFDALTTKRSYNKPMSPREAIEFMNTRLADRYDPEFLRAMVEVVKGAS